MNTKVKLFGYELKNPIIPASGTFGFGYEMSKFYDLNLLGSIALKGTTRDARYGNPLPRIAECGAGLINAIGLQNPGVDAVVKEEIPRLKKVFDGKVLPNVGGHSVKEYVETVEKFNDCDDVFAVELNISCPNVKGGGMAFGLDAKIAEQLVYQVKKVALKPIIVKLSPNVSDIAEMAKAVTGGGADGISLINTMVGMRIDIKTRKPIISVKTGGYSGFGLFPIALRMVNQVANAVDVPIIGLGGVRTAEDVIEMMMAGATAVQIGSENLINPFVCRDVVLELPNVMKKLNIENLTDIIGIVK